MSSTSEIASWVQSQISSSPVVVFSKSYCPYCAKAKSTLAKYPIAKDKIVIHEIDGRKDVDAIQDALLSITGGRSVPRVFVGGKFIGGGDDTVKLDQQGQLKQLLQAANAL